jgi:three-Cys-motif partner protein
VRSATPEGSRLARNRNEAQFDEYRDWQWIKHLILRQYAYAWSIIVGKYAREILVVDTCAGAGSYTDPDTGLVIAEGSPTIFAKRAQTYTRERGPGKSMRVICCEKNWNNYAALVEALRPYEPHVETLRGSFRQHVPQIADRLGTSPVLILLDPIGVATIPADSWRPFLERAGKTDLFFVLHFAGVHRVGGWLLPDGTPNPAIAPARRGVEGMDRVFNGRKWRAIALDSDVAGEEHRTERERRYVQLFFDQVIGNQHHWKGYIEVRARYTSPVKYWLVHASDDEKPYELMNDGVLKVNELLLQREHSVEGQLYGFADAALEAHRDGTRRELQQAIRERIESSSGGAMPFGAIRRSLANSFFGRVRWVGGYGEAVRALCSAGKVEREKTPLRAKFEDNEIIRAVAPGPNSDALAEVIPIKRVA